MYGRCLQKGHGTVMAHWSCACHALIVPVPVPHDGAMTDE